jgi:hypothetical protein
MSDFLTDVEGCLHPFYKKPSNFKRLEEAKSGTSVTLITEGRYLVYSFDTGGSNDSQSEKKELFPFFSQKPKLRRVCDYVIFCTRKSDDMPFVLIIELKTKGNPIPQLWATKQFVDFLINRVNAACNSNYQPEIKKIGLLEAMSSNLSGKYRSSGTRPGKILFDDKNIACVMGEKLVIADCLTP